MAISRRLRAKSAVSFTHPFERPMATQRNEDSRISRMDTPTRRERPDGERDGNRSVIGPIEDMIRQIGIDKVFGSPVTQGDTTVIPVADLRTGFGFGSGQDRTSGDEGGGGGGALRLTPQGYIHITPEGVRYRPIYDVSTFVVGGAFVGWLLYRLFSR